MEAIEFYSDDEQALKKKGEALLRLNGYRSGSYNPHNVKAYAIGNEFGVRVLAIGSCEQEALDNAVNCGLLDSEIMSDKDYQEYSENGWDDSFVYAGNASEPVWCEYLTIKEVTQ